MKILKIDVSNSSIGSYTVEGICYELQIVFSGIPDEWSGNRIYATFVQDNLNPTVEVIDNAVSVPSEILKIGTDFYVSIYSIPYGSNQVSEPSVPILVTVNSAESSEMDIGITLKKSTDFYKKIPLSLLYSVHKKDRGGFKIFSFLLL